jgi:nucleotide-binding universal stress UspA family protein
MNVQRILLPTDFSEHSKPAEKAACDLCDQYGAELHVLHVLQDILLTVPQTAAALMVPPQSLENEVTFAEQEIQRVPANVGVTGRKVVRAVRIGSIYDSIVQYATESAIDLIVLGTHGRTGLRHVLLGSVAERVVQHAPCSVLVVRPDRLAKVTEKTSATQNAAVLPVLETA